MEIKTGYLYHIKDEFFEKLNDDTLMTNHERGRKRPTYLAIQEKEILWFIPLSSKIDKYQKIINKKMNKYGICNTIIIGKIIERDHAILIQNAFPTLEKYVDHIHQANNAPARINTELQDEIISKFKRLIRMKERGINLFFTDIDKIKNEMLEELKKDKVKVA